MGPSTGQHHQVKAPPAVKEGMGGRKDAEQER